MKKWLSVMALVTSPVWAAGMHEGGHGMAHGDHAAMMGHHQSAGASAAGQAGDPAKVSRTIEVKMDDSMRFTPAKISVKAGETIRFFVKNTGKTHHEMVIGTAAELKEHAEMMRKMPDMQHNDANMLRLAAGQRGGLVWTFSQAGTVDFACLVPGHFEAGMKGQVAVE